MFVIVIRCPTHPTYAARSTPGACKLCRLVFQVRNEMSKVICVPLDERTDPQEQIVHDVIDAPAHPAILRQV